MNGVLSRKTCLCVALLLLGLFGFTNTRAQDTEIRFPNQPTAGQPVIIEMYWSSCNGYLFSSGLYDIHVVGTDVVANVDVVDTGGFGVCPPGTTFGWQGFQLPSLSAGSYTLSIYALPFVGGSPDPTGPLFLYATSTFTVGAAPPPPRSHSIPALSAWSTLLLIVLASLIGWLALRR